MPDSIQVQPFRCALTCIRALLEFTIRVQYRSHTSKTMDYMEGYTIRFHERKDIFLEFQVSKRLQAKVDEVSSELRRDRNQLNQSVAQSKGGRVRERRPGRRE